MNFKLYEYIDKRELLRTPAERQRLFKEIPPVIVDEEDTKDTTGLVENSHGEDKGFVSSSFVIFVPSYHYIQF